jgi:hypothetical protein
MAVSTDFAPPFRLIAPYFVIGTAFLVVSSILLFGLDITSITNTDPRTLSFVHLFLLGFVMMVIFGAMAQLVPVVLETGHFAVDLYYIIYPLLFIGTIMMGYGFLYSPAVLPYGGVIVLISLMVFVLETFLTINKVKKLNLVMGSVLISNISLFLGLIFGILMALGYAGVISVDIYTLLRSHIYLVLTGYVGVTIMGMSLILLPMFWLSHSFSWQPVTNALYIIVAGVLFVVSSSIFNSSILEYIGYVLSIIALGFYFYQIYIIYKTRVRLDNDVYLHSLVFSYLSLVFILGIGVVYLFVPNTVLFLSMGWLVLFGYITFMITGHLYKIVPFLVWYQKFSPLIGKRKVPMLKDMVPEKGATMQFVLTAIGVLIGALAIILQNNDIFKAGVSFLVVGSFFMLKNLIYMIKFEG